MPRKQGDVNRRSAMLYCRHCAYAIPAIAVWRGQIWACPRCGELLYPGSVRRTHQDGEFVDIIGCPYCGWETAWPAVEAIRETGPVLVHYQCESCLRPFVVCHDPTVVAEDVQFTERELAYLRFHRWRRQQWVANSMK